MAQDKTLSGALWALSESSIFVSIHQITGLNLAAHISVKNRLCLWTRLDALKAIFGDSCANMGAAALAFLDADLCKLVWCFGVVHCFLIARRFAKFKKFSHAGSPLENVIRREMQLDVVLVDPREPAG